VDICSLPQIGVDPLYQGKRLGAALIECGKVMLTADLASSNQLNVSLFDRLVFEKVGEIPIGSSPVVTPMCRAAQH
jgi:ribosomal protein S18 acetylase RimI-like enzyme